jgi:hypothetical protein
MPITSLSLVNQKLAHARALVRAASTLSIPGNAAERLTQQALLDGAVFHLVCGYQHYLHELAENYRVKNLSSVKDEKTLSDALAELGKESSEVVELALIQGAADSWLSQLQRYYHQLWALPLDESDNHNIKSATLIPLVVLDDVTRSVTLQQVEVWEKSFSTIITRHRETSAEY